MLPNLFGLILSKRPRPVVGRKLIQPLRNGTDENSLMSVLLGISVAANCHVKILYASLLQNTKDKLRDLYIKRSYLVPLANFLPSFVLL